MAVEPLLRAAHLCPLRIGNIARQEMHRLVVRFIEKEWPGPNCSPSATGRHAPAFPARTTESDRPDALDAATNRSDNDHSVAAATALTSPCEPSVQPQTRIVSLTVVVGVSLCLSRCVPMWRCAYVTIASLG